jgi:hypothetical protein
MALLLAGLLSGIAGHSFAMPVEAADATEFDSVKREALLEALVRTAQGSSYDETHDAIFGTYGRGREVERTLIGALQDSSLDYRTRMLASWLLSEIGGDDAKQALIQHIEGSSPYQDVSDETPDQEKVQLLRNAIMNLGKFGDEQVASKLEAWTASEYWESRIDFRTTDTGTIRRIRDAAKNGIANMSSPEAVALLERLAETTLSDFHPDAIKRILTEARYKAYPETRVPTTGPTPTP